MVESKQRNCLTGLSICIMTAIGIQLACNTQNSNTNEAKQQTIQIREFSNLVSADLIPWKTLNVENLGTSMEKNRWILIDSEQLGIFQIQRGPSDYRKSIEVKKLLVEYEVDCYYFFNEENDQDNSQMSKVIDFLQSALKDARLELKENSSVGFLLNFRQRKIFPIVYGTETELLQLFEHIKNPKSEMNDGKEHE